MNAAIVAMMLLQAAAPQTAERCPRSRETNAFMQYTVYRLRLCVEAAAASFAGSNEQARDIAITAISTCATQLEVTNEAVVGCYGLVIAERLRETIRSDLIDRGITAVVRARSPAPNPP